MTFARQTKRGSPSDQISTDPRTKFWTRLAAVGAAIALYFVISLFGGGPTSSANRLVTGAQYSGVTPQKIGFVQPADTKSPSQEEIIATREAQMERYGSLMGGAAYKPYKPLFEGIDPTRDWMSIAQLYYFGTEKPPAAVPREFQIPAASQSLLNPLLLVNVDFWGLSIWGPANLKWNHDKGSLEELALRKVPLLPRDPKLVYFPEQSRAEAEYSITQFIAEVNPYVVSPLTAANTSFAISLQNARDFGYTYFYLDLAGSEHIQNGKTVAGVSRAADFFGLITTAWGRQEPMNHSSANSPEYDWISASALPARARIKLWFEKPQDPAADADFIYDILLS